MKTGDMVVVFPPSGYPFICIFYEQLGEHSKLRRLNAARYDFIWMCNKDILPLEDGRNRLKEWIKTAQELLVESEKFMVEKFVGTLPAFPACYLDFRQENEKFLIDVVTGDNEVAGTLVTETSDYDTACAIADRLDTDLTVKGVTVVLTEEEWENYKRRK